MKTLGLDIGDTWVGIAISDELGITCRPYATVSLDKLEIFLQKTLHEENISTVIVGYPLTMTGRESQQTKKIIVIKEQLATKFKTINTTTLSWILWDERLSSKRAQMLQEKRPPSKEKKQKEHALAASFILQSYLDSLTFKNKTTT